MNRYTAPKLVPIGGLTELTLGMFQGTSDTDGITAKSPVGSVGFEL